MSAPLEPFELLEPVCFDVRNGIRLYTGDTVITRRQHIENIRYYQDENKRYKPLFTPLNPSTLTVNGRFSNISFDESAIIDMLTIEPGSHVLKIGCNFGEIVNPAPPRESIRKAKIKSNRGRKPKIKVSTRKKQGSGEYFSSQITFEIFNQDNDKIYKIKLFRNGMFQVPGGRETSMYDLIRPIEILRDTLRTQFVDPDIQPLYLLSVMRNYKCRINDDELLVHLDKLSEVLMAEKKSEDWYKSISRLTEYLYPGEKIDRAFIGYRNGIAEIQHSGERYVGLIVKLNTTIPWRTNKKTTIKILKSGKINFDGCNSELEARELYEWLMGIYRRNLYHITYDMAAEDFPVSTSEGESVYDD